MNLDECKTYVGSLYRDILGRAPGAYEFEYWVNFLYQGNTSETVYFNFVNSTEFKRRTAQDVLARPFRQDVLDVFEKFKLTPQENYYLQGQSARIGYFRDIVQKYCLPDENPKHVLDVGPHFLTRFIMDTIIPTPIVSTLGYAYPALVPPERVRQHATIDLNDCATAPSPFEKDSFDVILMCELVEHLFIPPDVVLSFLKTFLRQNGVIIVGTPNAVSISKRLRMTMGENPFQELSPEYRTGKVHIREYTMQELRRYGQKAGLQVAFDEYCNYWDQYLFPGSKEITELERELPMDRAGLAIVYRR